MLPRHKYLTDEERSKVEEKVGAIQLETPKMNPKTDSPSQMKRYVPSAKSPRHGAAKPPYILLQFTSLTDEQKSKVEEKLRGIQSEIPVYVAIMSNSNVNTCLCIPGISLAYAREYLPDGGENQLAMRMRLRCKDHTWEPDFQVRNRRQQICGEGWRKFVTDNKLKPDHICLLLQFTSLTDEQKSKVEEKLRGIQSEIPVYVAIMSNSNVNSRLCIPGISLAYAREYLPDGGENQLAMRMRLRRKDHTWEPDFQVRNRRQQICGEGWRKFVTDNKLKPDHICLFNLRKNTKTLTMDVQIIRKRSV